MEPAIASEKLICILAGLQERHKPLELCRIFRTDIGSLTYEVLRVRYPTNLTIDGFISKTRIDDDWAHLCPCRLQKEMATISHIHHILHRWYVLWVFLQIKKFRQLEVKRESCIIDWCVHGIVS